MKIIDYHVTTESDPIELPRNVRLLISQGWQPFGGVSTSMCQAHSGEGVSYRVEYAQAMVRYEPESFTALESTVESQEIDLYAVATKVVDLLRKRR